MPQPALHLLYAADALQRMRTVNSLPFDPSDTHHANAFMVGSLGPDMGLFPGGSAEFSRLAHTGRTAELTRALLRHASTPEQHAFARGWLSHVLADVRIHPLVNKAAAQHAVSEERAADGPLWLVDHVRVEVGLDAWLAWRHPTLTPLRLRPALDRSTISFIADAFDDVHSHRPSPTALLQMQRGALHFTHLALHFATTIARTLCWKRDGTTGTLPMASVLAWRLVTALSSRRTVVHAYLNPVMPAAWLLRDVDNALPRLHEELLAALDHGIDNLPDYNLEDGSLPSAAAA